MNYNDGFGIMKRDLSQETENECMDENKREDLKERI